MSGDDTQRIVDAVAGATRTRMGAVSAGELDVGWDRLEHALSGGKYPSVPVVRTRSRWWLGGLGLAAVTAVLALAVYRLAAERPAQTLQYLVEGATLGPQRTVTAGATPARLLFSDGSRVAVAPSSKLSVVAVDAHGSRIALADGQLDVEVRHLPDAAWRFDAGPFSVKVVGTAFRLAYEAGRGRLALDMVSGVVEASGPTAERAITLRAGESLELFAEPPAKEAADPVPAPAPAEPTLAPAPEPVAAPAPSRSRRSPPSERGAPAPVPWSRLIARGDFAGVVRDAEARGVDAVLAGASAGELNALADAARYTRRNDLARQALFGLRARFPGTAQAGDAAFFLGRLAELGPASSGAAVSWYEVYLAESARGPYASEALGRQLVLLARADRARARDVARRYLQRFPDGSQAELARLLLAP